MKADEPAVVPEIQARAGHPSHVHLVVEEQTISRHEGVSTDSVHLDRLRSADPMPDVRPEPLLVEILHDED